MLPILVISAVCAALFGWVSWLLWKAFRKERNVGARIGIGLCLAITGTVTLLSGVCGMLGLAS